MPTPAPSVAAPVAAVPAAQPASVAPVTPSPVATPPPEAKPTGRGSKLFGLLAAEAEVPPGTKSEVKKPDAKPATPAPDGKETKPVDPAAPAATPDDKPIRAEKKKAIDKRPGLPSSTPAPVSAAPAPTPAPTAPELDGDLIDEEKQLIEEAKEAEKYLPGRKGIAEQTRKFVAANKKFLAAHPDVDTDPEEKALYDKFLAANRPKLSNAEQRTISETRIAANVAKPLQERTDNLEHEIFVRDQEPSFRETRQRVASELNSTAVPADILEFAQKYGVDVAKKEFAEELKVVNHVVTTAASDYDELIRLETFNPKNGRPLAVPAGDEKDPRYGQHQRLLNIVQKVDGEFKENAKQGELLRDGKWFVTREEWAGIPAAERSKFWHFTNREIGTRMLQWVKPAVEQHIASSRQELEARGYTRRAFVPPAAATPPATPPVPVRSPGGPGASPVPAPVGAQPQATRTSRLAAQLAAD
jgi:hypothetical protein